MVTGLIFMVLGGMKNKSSLLQFIVGLQCLMSKVWPISYEVLLCLLELIRGLGDVIENL